MQQIKRDDSLSYTRIRLTDFGARQDSGEDATVPMRLALEAAARFEGSVVLDCPKGRYDFYPDNATRKAYYISNTASEEENADVTKTIGLFLQGLKDFILEGNGSSFIYHGRQTMMVLDGCERIELRNFIADYARPTIAEMTVERSGKGYVETKIHPDSRYELEDGKLFWFGDGWRFQQGPIQEYDPATNTTRRIDNWVAAAERVESIGPYRIRFSGDVVPELSAGIVLQMRDGLRDQVGTFATGCRDIRWSHVAMHYMHGLGIVCQYSENLDFDGMDLAPRPDSGRTAAAFADFIHLSGCRGKISIANSRFVGGHDDPINVHGTHLIVVGQPSANELLVRFMHPQTYGFAAFYPGDRIDFVRTSTLAAYARNRVISAESISPREIRLTLEQAVPVELREGDAIENITWTPEVEIRNNYFARIPTRGVLVTTRRKVVIENNWFDRITMSAVLIADDAENWYESGGVRDVTIRGNRFTECGNADHPVIRIEPENKSVNAMEPVHRNVCIERNSFDMNGTAVALHAKSTESLRFIGNEILLRERRTSAYLNAELLRLTACSNVEIANNSIDGRVKGLSVRIGLMAQDALHGFTEQEINLTEDKTTNN